MSSDSVVGTRVARVEDPPLLTGRSTFVANLDLPDALVAHYVTSIEAHALIDRIDTAEARAMPGVVDVVTAADLDGYGPVPGHAPVLPEATARVTLAADRVRFVGEPVAVVVAESEAEAADAAELVAVEYSPLPAVIGIEEALRSDTLLFPEVGSNVVLTGQGANDEPPDLSGAEVVVTIETVNQRVAPCPIEPRVAASYWTEDGRLIHHAACQGVHPIRNGLAAFYGLDRSRVRVITADVGGSFGAKAGLYPEDLLLPFLARRVGRPVRWMPSRREDMVGLGHSRAQRQRITVAGRRDGTIEAIEAEVIGDCGAYPRTGPALMRNAGMVLPGPLNVPTVHWTGKVVVTNTTPIVAYRGAGRPEGAAMLNRGIDAFAAEIGMDPLQVRRRNLLRPEELPWANPTGLVYDSGDYPAALELAVDEIGWDEARARQADERAAGATVVSGLGLGTFIDRTAGLPSDDWGSVRLRADGTFRVLTSSSPYGQGHYTAWAMLVAERTGVPLDRIEVFHGDTDVVPKGGITGGSRSAQRAGAAVADATEALVGLASTVAAELLEAAAGDVVLDLDRGAFHVAGSPAAASVDWPAVAAAVAAGAGSADAHGEEDGDDRTLACESDAVGDGPSVPYGMHAALVTVDIETGAVTIERLVTVDDAGTIINPMLVEGQLHGGIAQGIGQALYEEFVYDEAGNPQTGSFLDYAVPSAAEMPDFEVHVTDIPSPNNPLGVKGIAESGCIGVVPAIQNAVIDALSHLGVRHIDLPLTPERVWRAARQATA
ncbi:MAG: xanthine dehydrogenase family protein molybdopterin-binding subunit [Actinomycetota bacterium]